MLCWGGNAIAGQLAIGEITPFSLVFLRWVFVAAVMWALYGRAVLEEPLERPKIQLTDHRRQPTSGC